MDTPSIGSGSSGTKKVRGPRGKYKPRAPKICKFAQKQAALQKKYAEKPDQLAEKLLDVADIDDPARRAAFLHLKDLMTESLRPPPGRTRLAQAYPNHYSRVLNPKARQYHAKQEIKTILEERLASPKLRPLARVLLSMSARNRKSLQYKGQKVHLQHLLAEPAARNILKTLVSLLAIDRSEIQS